MSVAAGLLLAGLTACSPVRRPLPVVAPRPAPPPLPAPPPPASPLAFHPAPARHLQLPPAPPPPPRLSPVALLINASQRDYARGVELYRHGRLDAARLRFDRAVTRILASPLPVRATPALQAELNQLVDQIHALEMNALEAGDGFTAAREHPAPMDTLAKLTFPLTPAIRAQVERQIRNRRGEMPLALNGPVIRYIHYFTTAGRQELIRNFQRAGRYRAMIERIFRQEGIPRELIYLAQAESDFHNDSVSSAGARGMWQFMESRARGYGLRRNWWIDERQDPVLSTWAAARHLKSLHAEFGDWYLAMAAYDAGPRPVLEAVARTGYADFWQLYRRQVLPQETRHYVPIILALALIAKNPAPYGLTGIRPDPPLRMDTVRLTAPVDLRLAAECANASLQQMRRLNPDLLRLTTPNLPGFALHVPYGESAAFQAALDRIPPDKRVVWRYHRVRAGESLRALARRYAVRLRQLAAVNNLDPGRPLPRGARLVIPIRHRTAALIGGVYQVRRGDTLYGLARRFHLRLSDLRRWNHIRGHILQIGMHLWLQPHGRPRTPARPRHYRVRRGDTLAAIARRYHISALALRRRNRLRSAHLRVGQVLRIR